MYKFVHISSYSSISSLILHFPLRIYITLLYQFIYSSLSIYLSYSHYHISHTFLISLDLTFHNSSLSSLTFPHFSHCIFLLTAPKIVLVSLALASLAACHPVFEFEGEDQSHQQNGEAGEAVEGYYR